MKLRTEISKLKKDGALIRGYNLTELIGRVSFPGMIYLVFKGHLPSRNEELMLDAIFTSVCEHGINPPSTMASRFVAKGGVPLQAAVAAGVLTLGDRHGGAIEQCARILQQGVEETKSLGRAAEEVAAHILEDYRRQKKRVPGYGHQVYTEDPRTARLFDMAVSLNIAGPHLELARTIERLLAESSGHQLPLNVDGAIAAIISDMDFDWRLGKAFFIVGRTVGLCAHVYEEQTRRELEMVADDKVEYLGPPERRFPEGA